MNEQMQHMQQSAAIIGQTAQALAGDLSKIPEDQRGGVWIECLRMSFRLYEAFLYQSAFASMEASPQQGSVGMMPPNRTPGGRPGGMYARPYNPGQPPQG